MTRKPLVIASSALFLALTSLGITQALASKQGQGGTSASNPYTYELRVIDSLHLTASQRAAYDKLANWLDEETKVMYTKGSGMKEYGAEINVKWRAGLQKIFTPAQWKSYCEQWGQGEGSRPSGQGAGASSTDWEGLEKKILASLHLSPAQHKEIDALTLNIQAENQKLRELWEGTDPHAITVQSNRINKMQNEGMKRILTPSQWSAYRAAWDKALPKSNIIKAGGANQPIPRGSNQTPPPR